MFIVNNVVTKLLLFIILLFISHIIASIRLELAVFFSTSLSFSLSLIIYGAYVIHIYLAILIFTSSIERCEYIRFVRSFVTFRITDTYMYIDLYS